MVHVFCVMCGFVCRVLLLLKMCVSVLMVIYCVLLYGMLLCCCCCDCMLPLHVLVRLVLLFLCAVLWRVFACVWLWLNVLCVV